jgi:hypothetical protein
MSAEQIAADIVQRMENAAIQLLKLNDTDTESVEAAATVLIKAAARIEKYFRLY